MDFALCDRVEATFQPKRLDTLRDRAKPAIGKRFVWMCVGEAEEGDYEGEAIWEQYPPTEHVSDWIGWVPTEDLEDVVPAPTEGATDAS